MLGSAAASALPGPTHLPLSQARELRSSIPHFALGIRLPLAPFCVTLNIDHPQIAELFKQLAFLIL